MPTPEREALAELVYCKDLKERCIALSYERIGNDGATDTHPELPELRREYDQRMPLAWEAARAAISSQPPAPTWQPIETAPKDVPLILHEDGRVFKGGFCEVPFREFRDEDGFYTGQQDADAFWMDYGSGDSCNPTHWQHEQPLPSAHSTEGAAG